MKSPARIIGVDESGKGDFLGPLVVAACLVPEDADGALRELGVRDSKQISPARLLTIDKEIRERFVHTILVVSPKEYNQRYEQIKNLNILLAQGHARVIRDTAEKALADLAISDKFGKDHRLLTALADLNCAVPTKQMVRGESQPAVAAASIIARAEFVYQMQELSNECGFELPKGAAAQVDRAGQRLVEELGLDALANYAKLHFKNYRRVLNPTLFPK